jgi:hypothetical protein
VPLLEDPEAPRDPSCTDAIVEIAERGAAYPTVAVRTAAWKYIHHEAKRDEAYDLLRDPGEMWNLAPGAPGEVERLRRIALDVAARRRGEAAQTIELEGPVLRELEALGYLTGDEELEEGNGRRESANGGRRE